MLLQWSLGGKGLAPSLRLVGAFDLSTVEERTGVRTLLVMDDLPTRGRLRAKGLTCAIHTESCQPIAKGLKYACSRGMSTDKQNTQGTPGDNEEADTASGGAPETPDTTDESGRPVENPSG